MRKQTEILLLTTGIGLAALWVWYRKNHSLTADQLALEKQEEDPGEGSEDSFLEEVMWGAAFDDYFSEGEVKGVKKPKGESISFYDTPDLYTGLGATGFYKWLRQSYETTQLTITNTSDIAREVRLWAGNKKPPLSPSLPGDIDDHVFETLIVSTDTAAGIYPQGMVVNPFNGLIYIANQLSNNISVINTEGRVLHLIPISGSTGALPAVYDSPVDLTVNSQPDSPNFGKVYVVNVVSDTVTVINTQMEVEKTIPVGLRPISITFNPFNEQVYVANIADNTISSIDSVTDTIIDTVNVGQAPRSITVQPKTGEVFVINSGEDTISVIDTNNQVQQTIAGLGNGLTTAAYHPENNKLYVVASRDHMVIPIDLDTGAIEPAIPVGANPFTILYNPNTQLMYVGNRDDDTYSIIGTNNRVISTLSLGAVNIGMAIDVDRDIIYSSNPTGGSIALITYSLESSAVTINEGYEAKREDFTFRPAMVKHVKFVLSGSERFRVLQLEEETVSGTTQVRPVSFSSYTSPQNFGNVAEVFEMEGSIIDGKNGWAFKIGGNQTITILTYYRQVETEHIIDQELLTE